MARVAYVKGKDGKPEIFTVDGKKFRKAEVGGKLFPVKTGKKGKKSKAMKAAKASVSPEKLLKTVLKAAANPKAVALADMSAKELEALVVISKYPELVKQAGTVGPKDIKDAETIKANRKIFDLATAKAKK